jgi:hypothetical protein
LGCRAQAASPAERGAENDQLQIERPLTELNICSFLPTERQLFDLLDADVREASRQAAF